MLLKRISIRRRLISPSLQKTLFYQSSFNESTNSDFSNNILFGANTKNEMLSQAAVELSRSDFGFYQKLLPIDTVQSVISNLNFLFDMPYWTIVLALPFLCKSLITMPIHIYQQRKYEKRLKTLPIAVYETNKLTHRERLARKRGASNSEEHLRGRREISEKYGYDVSKTQLLPYTAAAVQIPIHLTMFVSLRTMSSEYPLWSDGGPHFLSNFSNLSVIDSSMMLPLSIGCTMAVLQYILYKRNETRSAGIRKNGLMAANVFSVLAISYLSMSWSVGFNFYILSNLSSYVIQQKLMDSNIFRTVVGLSKYSVIQPDVKKLQIMYACMQLAMKSDGDVRLKTMEKTKDKKSAYNAVPQMEYTWMKLLQNPDNFAALKVTEKELDAVRAEICSIDDVEYFDEDEDEEEEEEYDESDETSLGKKQYSMQFTDREEVEIRRQQIRKATAGKTMRSFLMEKDLKNKQSAADGGNEAEEEFIDDSQSVYKGYEEVSIQEVESEPAETSQKKKRKKKIK